MAGLDPAIRRMRALMDAARDEAGCDGLTKEPGPPGDRQDRRGVAEIRHLAGVEPPQAAPVIVEEMADTIIELKRAGLSVLLSEQNIHFTEVVCYQVYVLEKGQIQWTGPLANLAGNIDVQRRLLSV